MAIKLVVLSSLIFQLASAHFQINYPYWRGNSFLAPGSQYTYPCANIDQTNSTNNRTLWPLTGGSLAVDFHHPFTYVFINLGLGTNATNFNISLTALPLNETGAGNLCLPQVVLPAGLGIQDGTNASIQISTVGPEGTALYNCADITFSSTATLLSGSSCVNDTGVSIAPINEEFNGSTSATTTTTGNASSTNDSSSSSSTKSAAGQTWRVDTVGFMVTAAAVLCLGFGNM